MSLIDLRGRSSARAALHHHVEAAAAASVRPPSRERFMIPGPDPLRILLLGGGTAVGYGAASRALALDGQLGSRIAERTGRGVIVNNIGTHDARLAEQIRRAGVVLGYGTSDLVVWCPSYVEMTDGGPAARWEWRLHELLQLTPARAALVLELPVPLGDDPAAAAAAPIIGRINRRLRRAAQQDGQIALVTPPALMVRPVGEPLFDPAYYAELAESITDAASPMVRSRLAGLPVV